MGVATIHALQILRAAVRDGGHIGILTHAIRHVSDEWTARIAARLERTAS